MESLVQLVVQSPHPDSDGLHQAPYLSTSLFREQYVALVLGLLFDVGLIDALVSVVEHSPATRDYASDILARILRFSHRALPDESTVMHAFPGLLNHLCLPEEPIAMVDAASAMRAIDDASARYERDRKRTMVGSVMWDETYFRALIRDSMVVATKEISTWNIAIVEELLDGPLHDPRRFEEALTSTKLIRRLVSFFRPSSQRYATLPQSETGRRWTEMGAKLVRILLCHPEGVRLLVEDRFLVELRDAFDQLAQMPMEALFSSTNLKRTMVGGYFDMLGALSGHEQGLEILAHARLFSTWMKLCDVDTDASSRVLEALVEKLDVTSPSHTRMFLERTLTKAPAVVRRAATERVARALWLDGETQPWAMSLLLAQLHDVAQSGPPVDLLLSDDTLALQCLAVPLGFHTMSRQGLLAPLAEAWHRQEHMAYVQRVEQAVAPDQSMAPLPPHLYGQLARTESGCQYLEELRVLPEWVSLLHGDRREAYDAHILHQVKAALWACGHVGASDLGVPLLEAHGLLDALVAASSSPVVSIRGTSFYACGLVSLSARGRDALSTRHWTTRGLCLPVDRRAFVHLNEPQSFVSDAFASRLVPAEDKSESDASTLFARLGNGVIAGQTRRALVRMHEQDPALFQRVSLLARALHLMDHFPMRLAARRTIWALMSDCEISLETVTALQRWRSAHVAVAPAVPTRRAAKTQPSQASRSKDPYLYHVPNFRLLQDGETDTRSIPLYAQPSLDDSQPRAAVMGSVSRHEWPLQMRGFV
ncbi:hypothetical protein MCAP1_000109 [Malassezia caprae]|uniref:Uncharacterized protein n=1 Tax=Malassezia caprae TaxID=1381934 RepID=A0AAF0E2T4_9BASI|nr:hypothetical protein MCAP1_000109 [Malassezia caprae]